MKRTVFFSLFFSFFLIVHSISAQELTIQEEKQTELLPHPETQSSQPNQQQNKLSLELKGMDIVDILKMLSTRTGLNIVIGKNVTGRVTLFLKDVDAWDAFEIILLSNDLAYEKKGEIISIMTQRDYELLYGDRFQNKKQAKVIPLKYAKAADLASALNQIKTNIGKIVVNESSNTLVLIDTPQNLKSMEDFIAKTDLPTQTKIFSLNYAQAEKISPKIQENLTKSIGYIRIDERTNKIAVTDYPAKLEEIEKIITAFDEKTPQVIIDAQIIQISPSDKFEMGVDWDYWLEKHFDFKAALPIGTANRLLLGTTSNAPAQQGDYKAILDLLRTIGDTKILSSPRIMALNNQEAKILVGTKEAYITSTTSQSGTSSTVTSQSVNFVDVGIKLFVTPTINQAGFVTMKIKPEISTAKSRDLISENQTTQVPIVTTSEAETTVMVKDGITIIIGGLRKDERSKTVKKIPLLGDVPLLGFFFRSTSDDLTKTELVILLTPHIVSGENTITDFAQLPPKEGVRAEMKSGEITKEKFSLLQQDSTTNPSSLPSPLENRVFLDYYKLITDKINQFARLNPPKDKKGEVSLDFTVSYDGSLRSGPTVINTTDSSLTFYAIYAVRDALPFPSFPKGLGKKEENFHITIAYK